MRGRLPSQFPVWSLRVSIEIQRPKRKPCRFDGAMHERIVMLVQILRQHIRELALMPHRDQLHRGKPQLNAIGTSAFHAQRVMKHAEIRDDLKLKRLRQLVINLDNPVEPAD